MWKTVLSSGMAFGFLCFCAEEICCSKIFLGRVTKRYLCSVGILSLFSFNVAEGHRAIAEDCSLSLITFLYHLHHIFWSHWDKWKEVGRRVTDGHSRDQHFLFSHLQWLQHPGLALSSRERCIVFLGHCKERIWIWTPKLYTHRSIADWF